MVLNEIAWAFKDKLYSNLKEFNKDVQQYQVDILGDEDVWKPDEIVANCPQIQVCYEAWLKSPKDLLKNESLTAPVSEEVDEDEYVEAEVIAKFDADNGQNFSAAEFLMKVHNTLSNKELGDHIFFEGIEEDDEDFKIPTFYIICGS